MSQVKLVSWNVNGIRSVCKKGFLEWLATEQPDILGIQETKIDGEKLVEDFTHPPGYQTFWSHCQEKKGYSGVAIYTKIPPLRVVEGMGVPAYDTEGRTLMAEFENFILFNIYYPNGQRSEERLTYKMNFYAAFLQAANQLKDQGKPLVICGDFNTAHFPIDLARPKENEKVSGFLPIERAWMDEFVSHGYVDTFRVFHPEPNRYSWWNVRSRARERNVGWRIDYFFVSPDLRTHLTDADIHDQVLGSDHCPVSVTLSF